MKHFKIGFLSVIATLAMSYTVISHEKVFLSKKSGNLMNCYSSGVYYENPNSSCSFITLGCDLGNAPGKPVSQVSGRYHSSTVDCSGTNSVLCCVSLEAGSFICSGQMQGDGSVKDYQNQLIPTDQYVVIREIKCKP